ncbi:MAG TPA: polysaccharide deacetylase [Bryobacteraceae bacterium]|nr:polysaccharide deacetylase [Bryobacteraceae bacterium]
MKFPVLLTFDLDGELLWTSRDPKNWDRPIALSQGVYAYQEGVPRILALLEKYGIHCTFFIPGMIIERQRKVVCDIHSAGHEIAHHSYSHRWLQDMEEADERQEFEKTTELIKGVTGSKPLGWRSPAGEFSKNTMRLLLEYEFLYSSNFFDRDQPYKHIVNGKKTNLIEFPFAWVLDDAPFFLYSIQLTGRVMMPPSAVFEHWSAEFDQLYAERKAFVLAMHPQIIGRPSRITLLERLIQHIQRHPDIQFYRCDQLALELKDAI